MTIKNIAQNFFKRGYSFVMLNKVIARLREPGKAKLQVAREWYAREAINLEDLAPNFNRNLLEEAEAWNKELTRSANETLSKLPVSLGGGGNCVLLYYLVRKIQPSIVLETGVAAGFSSKTILTALEANGKGILYSSDFPYFRFENPEQYVGILVNEELRKSWKLLTKGDKINLPSVVQSLAGKKLNLFHYDSDKSYAGRVNALKVIKPHLDSTSLIVFDDIVDNGHFMDLVKQQNWPYYIVKFEGKLVGITAMEKQSIDFLFS